MRFAILHGGIGFGGDGKNVLGEIPLDGGGKISFEGLSSQVSVCGRASELGVVWFLFGSGSLERWTRVNRTFCVERRCRKGLAGYGDCHDHDM